MIWDQKRTNCVCSAYVQFVVVVEFSASTARPKTECTRKRQHVYVDVCGCVRLCVYERVSRIFVGRERFVIIMVFDSIHCISMY